MIIDALKVYIATQTGLACYVGEAPLSAGRCVVIDDNGDFDDRHWGYNGQITSGLIEQECEITIWTDLEGGGPKWAKQQAQTIKLLLNNFQGPLIDTASSPSVTHRVAFIESNDGGGSLDSVPEKWGHSVFCTITYT